MKGSEIDVNPCYLMQKTVQKQPDQAGVRRGMDLYGR